MAIPIFAIGMIAALILLVLVAVLTKVTLTLIKGPLRKRLAAVYRPDQILMQDLGANCFGVESAGVWQARGNGALALTADRLHFFYVVPRTEVQVPLSSITEITFPKGHLGKVTPFELLKVSFVANGAADSVAWLVRNPREWKARIESLRDTSSLSAATR